MLCKDTQLNSLEDMEYRWTTTQEWTPHWGRVSTFGTHVHSSAGYPAERISARITLEYTSQTLFLLPGTIRSVLEHYVSSTQHHAYYYWLLVIPKFCYVWQLGMVPQRQWTNDDTCIRQFSLKLSKDTHTNCKLTQSHIMDILKVVNPV